MDTAAFQPCSSRAGNGFSFSLTEQDDKQQTVSFFQVESHLHHVSPENSLAARGTKEQNMK